MSKTQSKAFPWSAATNLFRLFISIDLLLMLIHIFYIFHNPRGIMESYWSIETDRGFGESFQYIKEILLIFIFVWLGRRYFKYTFYAWALFYLYILIDDMLRLHERIGAQLSAHFHYGALLGLRPEDLGELTFLSIFGVIFFLLLGSAYIMGRKNRKLKLINRNLISLALFLILFGVFTDAFHAVFMKFSAMIGLSGITRLIGFYIFGLIEDGGEMIVMSFAVRYAFYLLNRPLLFNRPGLSGSVHS